MVRKPVFRIANYKGTGQTEHLYRLFCIFVAECNVRFYGDKDKILLFKVIIDVTYYLKPVI